MVSLNKKPEIENAQSSAKSSQELARFISEGDKRPSKNASKVQNFRFSSDYVELLESVSEKTGMNKTIVMKAALLMFSQIDDNQKNVYLLEASRG